MTTSTKVVCKCGSSTWRRGEGGVVAGVVVCFKCGAEFPYSAYSATTYPTTMEVKPTDAKVFVLPGKPSAIVSAGGLTDEDKSRLVWLASFLDHVEIEEWQAVLTREAGMFLIEAACVSLERMRANDEARGFKVQRCDHVYQRIAEQITRYCSRDLFHRGECFGSYNPPEPRR